MLMAVAVAFNCEWCLLAIYILVLKSSIEMAQKSFNQLLKCMLKCIMNLLLIEFTKTVQNEILHV